jgi:hypothetical protein
MESLKFQTQGRGTRITEREFIGNVTSGTLSGGSTIFSNSSYLLNPTNSSLFPWLSRFADLYDQWEPHGIILEFVTTSSEYNGSSQALGTVIMATDYDPYDQPFANKQEMENSDYACSTKPSNDLLHGIECAVKERPTRILFCKQSNANVPLTNVNLGLFQLATQGCSTSGTTLGELWITYDITFYKKQLSLPTFPFLSGTGSLSASVGFWSGMTVSASNTITYSTVLGVGSRLNFNNSIAGETYQVCYFNTDYNTSNPSFAWTVVNGATVSTRVTNLVVSEAYMVTFVIVTTSANCYLESPLTGTATPSAYSLGASLVPTGYLL